MSDELNQVGADDPGSNSLEVPDSEITTDDSGLDAAPAEDQVASPTTATTPPELSLDDVPEEYRPLVEAKLKNLESGYNKKYQTLAAERRVLEAQMTASEQARSQIQQPETAQTTENPFANVDWEYETDATKALYNAFGQVVTYLQQADGKLQQLDSHFTKTQLAEQLAEVHKEYGDFDDQELLGAASKNPGVPLEFVAAKVLGPAMVEKAKQGVYQNVETKRKANMPISSGANVKSNVDTSKWGLMDFFNHAKRTGERF